MIILSRHPWLGCRVLMRTPTLPSATPPAPCPGSSASARSSRSCWTLTQRSPCSTGRRLSRCCDWPALVDLAMGWLVPPVRPCDESIIDDCGRSSSSVIDSRLRRPDSIRAVDLLLADTQPTWNVSAALRPRVRVSSTTARIIWSYVLKGYAIMAPPLPSPEPPPNRLRPDHASGPRQVLTDSTPAPPEAAARPLVQMPAAGTPCDRACTTALVAACQRALLKRHSQNTHVKLRTVAQTVIQTAICRSARRMRPRDTAPNHSADPASTAGASFDGATNRTPLPTRMPAPAVTTISVRGACEIQRRRLDLIRAADI